MNIIFWKKIQDGYGGFVQALKNYCRIVINNQKKRKSIMFGSFYYESKEIFNTLYLRIISCSSVTIKTFVQTGSLMISSKADRQIWQCFFCVTTQFTTLDYSHGWIPLLSFAEEYNRTKVTRHTNEEYELFTYAHTSKCVVTLFPLRCRKLV